LLIGVVFTVIGESRDRKLRDPNASTVYLNLPELGVIPSVDLASDRSRGLRNLLRGSGPHTPKPSAVGLNDSGVANGGAPPEAPSVAEAIRSTLTSILFSGQNGSRPRVIVVSSPGPEEGKSTLVSNLGIALAEINHKVLLIGADLRNPRLHDIFRVSNAQGLSNILGSPRPVPDRTLESLTQKTAIPNLYVLPSGPKTVSTSNLLHSDRMRELVRSFRSEFDTIVIDTPPVLLFSDARVLGRIAETVVLVIRSGHTTRDAALAAKKRLHDDGTHILGTVLTDWKGEHADPAYHYARYANYGHEA
jgi:succinoglycan biosynthesis transport protein ExoP